MNGGLQKFIQALLGLGIVASAQAFDATVAHDAGTVTISWPSIAGKQYQVYANDQLPVGTSNPVGTWLVGDDSALERDDSITGNAKQFYSVVQRDDFEIDVAGAGYGTAGNNWTYSILDERRTGSPTSTPTVTNYTATYTVQPGLLTLDSADAGVTANWDGAQVVLVSATSIDNPTWSQQVYLSSDFSNGVYQVGGVRSATEQDFPGVFTNTGAAPLLLANFTPGAVVQANYTNTNYGAVTNTIQHDIVQYTLPGASEPSDAIRVTSVSGAETFVQRDFGIIFGGVIDVEVSISSTVIDTYVDEVGLVEKIIDVDVTDISGLGAAPEFIDVTIQLQSYNVN